MPGLRRYPASGPDPVEVDGERIESGVVVTGRVMEEHQTPGASGLT
jgi:hypothetical protein